MESNERKTLGDAFDKAVRALDGMPNVIKTKATTVRGLSKMFDNTQTFIIQTYRQRDDQTGTSKDTIFLEYVGADGSFRLPIPPEAADVIARQRDALTGKSRSRAAKARADSDKAAGKLPGFMKLKTKTRINPKPKGE